MLLTIDLWRVFGKRIQVNKTRSRKTNIIHTNYGRKRKQNKTKNKDICPLLNLAYTFSYSYTRERFSRWHLHWAKASYSSHTPALHNSVLARRAALTYSVRGTEHSINSIRVSRLRVILSFGFWPSGRLSPRRSLIASGKSFKIPPSASCGGRRVS